MRFGTSYAEIQKEPSGGGGGNFIHYMQDKPVTLRILDEPETWEGAWEHFDNSIMKSYPCTQDRDTCPGCTSPSEKTQSRSRKIYFNAAHEYEGQLYVNLWKISRATADLLNIKIKKIRDNGDHKVSDCDFTFTKFGEGKQTRYDIEREEYTSVDVAALAEKKFSTEVMLNAAFDDAWGEGASEGAEPKPQPRQTKEEREAKQETYEKSWDNKAEDPVEKAKREIAELEAKKAELLAYQAEQDAEREKLKAEAPPGSPRAESGSEEDPPSEPEVEQEPVTEGEDTKDEDPGEPDVTLEELKAMSKGKLVSMIAIEQKWGRLPETPKAASSMTAKQLVDWLLEQ